MLLLIFKNKIGFLKTSFVKLIEIVLCDKINFIGNFFGVHLSSYKNKGKSFFIVFHILLISEKPKQIVSLEHPFK